MEIAKREDVPPQVKRHLPAVFMPEGFLFQSSKSVLTGEITGFPSLSRRGVKPPE
jgi:hypothetical protein